MCYNCIVLNFVVLPVCLCVCLSVSFYLCSSVLLSTFVVNKHTHYSNASQFRRVYEVCV